MPDPPPGQRAYAAYFQTVYPEATAMTTVPFVALTPDQQRAWEAAAQAVLEADEAGRHTTTAFFRFGLGAVLRLAGSPCPWRVRSRRWVEREVLPPYAEYQVTSLEDLTCWEVEADLEPWEDTHA